MFFTIALTLGLSAQGTTTDATNQKTTAPVKQWVRLTNHPGYEGYGAINANGWLVTEKFRPLPGRAAQPTQSYAAQPAQSGADPTGMVGTLNGIRARHGLPAVSYDPNAAHAAAINNGQQAARGVGHHYTGGYAQNSAMGSDIWGMWMNSPAHRAMILNPNLKSAGGATNGAYSTLNATGHYGGAVQMLAGGGQRQQQQYQTGVVASRRQFRLFGGLFSRR